MKKILFILVALVAISSSSFAYSVSRYSSNGDNNGRAELICASSTIVNYSISLQEYQPSAFACADVYVRCCGYEGQGGGTPVNKASLNTWDPAYYGLTSKDGNFSVTANTTVGVYVHSSSGCYAYAQASW